MCTYINKVVRWAHILTRRWVRLGGTAHNKVVLCIVVTVVHAWQSKDYYNKLPMPGTKWLSFFKISFIARYKQYRQDAAEENSSSVEMDSSSDVIDAEMMRGYNRGLYPQIKMSTKRDAPRSPSWRSKFPIETGPPFWSVLPLFFFFFYKCNKKKNLKKKTDQKWVSSCFWLAACSLQAKRPPPTESI